MIPCLGKCTNICAWLSRICVSRENVLVFPETDQIQISQYDKPRAIKNVFNSRHSVASPSFSSSPWLPADFCRQRCCSWRCSSSASAPLMLIRRRAPSFLPRVGWFTHRINMSAWQILRLALKKSLSPAASWRVQTPPSPPPSEFWVSCVLIGVAL